MPQKISQISTTYAVCAQMEAEDMAWAANQGFKTVINNRPDGEGGAAQAPSKEMESAARAAGLHYVYLPVVSGAITQEQVVKLAQVLQEAPAPVLAFCRSGARSTQLFSLAQSLA